MIMLTYDNSNNANPINADASPSRLHNPGDNYDQHV